MRARCERHGLAIGPSGCLVCRREQVAAPATTSSRAPILPSAPPDPGAVAALGIGAPPVANLAAPAPAAIVADSALAAPATVTDAPESSRFTIRIPPVAFLAAAAATLAVLVASFALSPAVAEGDVAAASAASAPVDSTELEAAGELDGEGGEAAAAGAEAASPPVAPEVTAAQIAELEKARARAAELDAARSRVKVTIYYNERCARCAEAMGYLRAQGIRAVERDIDKDAKARARHRALARRGGLPTIEIDGKVLVGFQQERVNRAIERAAQTRLQRKR